MKNKGVFERNLTKYRICQKITLITPSKKTGVLGLIFFEKHEEIDEEE